MALRFCCLGLALAMLTLSGCQTHKSNCGPTCGPAPVAACPQPCGNPAFVPPPAPIPVAR